MVDPLLLSAPFLLLPVVALLRFIGCDVVFGLHHVDPPDPPQPPSDLQATAGEASIVVSWTAPPAATSYKLYRTTPDRPDLDPQVVIPLIPTAYTDSAVMPGVRYCYAAAALTDTLEGMPSNSECATAQFRNFMLSEVLGTLRSDFAGFSGMAIRVGSSPLTVFALGRFVAPGNGVNPGNTIHEIRIFDVAANASPAGGTVLADTTPGAAGMFVQDSFVFADLPSPVTLNTNAEYFIVSAEKVGGEQWYDQDTSVTTRSEASVTSPVFSPDGVTFTRGAPGAKTYGPVSFLYS